jgi:hypothetical protein
MKTPRIANLPTATEEFESGEEQTMRRTAEQYMAGLHDDISDQQNQTSAPSSLALKRFQFLLMGA